jgi:hypothetical protein
LGVLFPREEKEKVADRAEGGAVTLLVVLSERESVDTSAGCAVIDADVDRADRAGECVEMAEEGCIGDDAPGDM